MWIGDIGQCGYIAAIPVIKHRQPSLHGHNIAAFQAAEQAASWTYSRVWKQTHSMACHSRCRNEYLIFSWSLTSVPRASTAQGGVRSGGLPATSGVMYMRDAERMHSSCTTSKRMLMNCTVCTVLANERVAA